MEIADIQWRTYRVPFLRGFSTAHGVTTIREGIIVEITTEEGICGIGEIAPLAGFSRESLTDVYVLLPKLIAHLHGKTLADALDFLLPSPAEKMRTEVDTSVSASTICGLEVALLDALGKAEGCGVSRLLCKSNAEPRRSVKVNAVVGERATQEAVAAAQRAKNSGFGCVKLKVGCMGSIQDEVERVAAVREAIGPDAHLRLDANEAWSLEEAIAILSRCIPYAIQFVEQPLKAQDLVGMHTLRRAVPMSIAADEALYDVESARRMLDGEAADILIVKPQLVGGLRAGLQIMQEAAERGVRSVVTSTLEAGIGLVAVLHLAAASPTIDLECGLATLQLLVDDLLIDELAIRDGSLAVPSGTGLGVELDREALERYIYAERVSR